LLDVAGSHFPQTLRILGPESFAIAVSEFLKLNPSRTPMVDLVFRDFPNFFENQNHRELAMLEWSTGFGVYSFSEKEKIDPTLLTESVDWPNAVFELRSDVYLFNAASNLNAVMEGATEFSPIPQNYLIYFDGDRARVDEIEPMAARLLESLKNGLRLQEAIEQMAPRQENASPADTESISDSVSRWFQQWMARGLFKSFKVTNP
jgi:hypothetical protein